MGSVSPWVESQLELEGKFAWLRDDENDLCVWLPEIARMVGLSIIKQSCSSCVIMAPPYLLLLLLTWCYLWRLSKYYYWCNTFLLVVHSMGWMWTILSIVALIYWAYEQRYLTRIQKFLVCSQIFALNLRENVVLILLAPVPPTRPACFKLWACLILECYFSLLGKGTENVAGVEWK